MSKFQTHFNDKYLKYFLCNCYQVNDTTTHWSLVNIGSGNGLVPSGNKPLPEPVLTQISATIWRHRAPKGLSNYGLMSSKYYDQETVCTHWTYFIRWTHAGINLLCHERHPSFPPILLVKLVIYRTIDGSTMPFVLLTSCVTTRGQRY